MNFSAVSSGRFYVISELTRAHVSPSRIYVVYVSSNPESDLPEIEGRRFLSGTLLGTLLAAGSIFEQARAERGDHATDELAKHLSEGHLIQWSLSSRVLFDSIRDQGPTVEPDADKRKRIENELLVAPLGWTLDEDAAADIEHAGFHHAAWLASSDCSLGEASDRGLCNALTSKAAEVPSKKDMTPISYAIPPGN